MKWLGPFWTPELSTKKGNPQEQIEQFPIACVYSWFIYVYMFYYVFCHRCNVKLSQHCSTYFRDGNWRGEQGLAPHLDDSIVRDPPILVALVIESLWTYCQCDLLGFRHSVPELALPNMCFFASLGGAPWRLQGLKHGYVWGSIADRITVGTPKNDVYCRRKHGFKRCAKGFCFPKHSPPPSAWTRFVLYLILLLGCGSSYDWIYDVYMTILSGNPLPGGVRGVQRPIEVQES